MTLSFRILLKLNISVSQKAKKLPHDIGGGESYEVDRSRGRGLCLRRHPAISREVSGYGLEIASEGGGAFLTAVDVALFPDRKMLSHFTLYFRRHLNF